MASCMRDHTVIVRYFPQVVPRGEAVLGAGFLHPQVGAHSERKHQVGRGTSRYLYDIPYNYKTVSYMYCYAGGGAARGAGGAARGPPGAPAVPAA